MKVRFAVAPGSALPDLASVHAFTDAVEGGGFDGVWLSDLPVGPGIDPLLGLAVIAGRSARVRLGANIVPLGRNPFLLAKALAQLDQLSAGRVLLSFVPGIDQAGEREALRWEGRNRGAALEHGLAQVRAWWAGEQPVQRESPELAALMRPVQDPLEVWLGGRGPLALERIGRVSDGWLGAAVTPAEALVARLRIEESAAQAGRQVDPEHFGLSIAYAHQRPDDALLERLRGRRQDVDPMAFIPVGAAALRESLAAYIEAGLSKFVVRPAAAPASWAEEMAWLGEAILAMQT